MLAGNKQIYGQNLPVVINGQSQPNAQANPKIATHAALEMQSATDALAKAVAKSLHAVTGLKGQVTLVGPGRLPNDGRVIEDKRSLA